MNKIFSINFNHKCPAVAFLGPGKKNIKCTEKMHSSNITTYISHLALKSWERTTIVLWVRENTSLNCWNLAITLCYQIWVSWVSCQLIWVNCLIQGKAELIKRKPDKCCTFVKSSENDWGGGSKITVQISLPVNATTITTKMLPIYEQSAGCQWCVTATADSWWQEWASDSWGAAWQLQGMVSRSSMSLPTACLASPGSWAVSCS